ncbi:CarboxypepD_reg-like domain-containing protein [Parapedobacter composti]|uniref:CarboxypepD_reg-like domain-containing protein n=1 Tax=Parapedobacter composti TaxID=623281 RepID=A0A1I1GS89_9SPHI|nr:carboxypeptidase-like regulatory domain-containing protein [Parapedobacter composti]SFC14162.1 CarboxypepD_reg-like domain-containing protein [Parapedobacter composti]
MNGFLSYVVLLAAGLAGWGIPVIAQQRIAGKVVNAETGEPIAGASVFVNNTTYGTSSTNSGDFELRGIPVGTYEVVVSSVGYHTFVSPIRVTESRSAFLAVKLEPRSLMLDEVTIMPFEAAGWILPSHSAYASDGSARLSAPHKRSTEAGPPDIPVVAV